MFSHLHTHVLACGHLHTHVKIRWRYDKASSEDHGPSHVRTYNEQTSNHTLCIIYGRLYLPSCALRELPRRSSDSTPSPPASLPETSQCPWSKPSPSLKYASGDNGYSIWNLDFSQNTYNIWSPKLEMKHPISNMFLEKKKKSPLETGN